MGTFLYKDFIYLKMKGLAVGLNKGFITTKITKPRERAVLRKGTLGKRTSLVRKVVRECTGFAPYEKRVFKLIKVMELINKINILI